MIGLDPGLFGAIAVVSEPWQKWRVDRLTQWDARKSVATRKQVVEIIRAALQGLSLNNTLVIMEDVHAMPNQGVSSVHGFGLANGALQMFMQDNGAKLVFLSPAQWKRGLALPADKHASIELAKIWKPDQKWLKTS